MTNTPDGHRVYKAYPSPDASGDGTLVLQPGGSYKLPYTMNIKTCNCRVNYDALEQNRQLKLLVNESLRLLALDPRESVKEYTLNALEVLENA